MEYRRYEIPETVSIWICDFELPRRMKNYIDEWAIYSKEMLNSGIIETVFPKWLYVLKHAHEGDPLPDFGNGIVNEALKRIKIENLDKTTLTELEREMIAKEEIECRLAGAKIETRYEMVDAMLANPKFTDEDISSISGIPQEEIRKRRTQR